MRLLVLSDLHVEHAPFTAPDVPFDRVVLAGDIHNGVAALEWARTTFAHAPILQIAGNHEFYDHDYDRCLAAMRERARQLDIDFLENESRVLGGVEFFGCTLWSDFRVFEQPGRSHQLTAGQAMQANQGLIADYHAIGRADGDDGPARRFAPQDARDLFDRSLAWLEPALQVPAAMPRVVVSHHLPSWRSVVPAFEKSVTNAAFVSDLDRLLDHADLWIHGHSHASASYGGARCRVVCNPRGYPSRRSPGLFENRTFDPARVIDLPPAAGPR